MKLFEITIGTDGIDISIIQSKRFNSFLFKFCFNKHLGMIALCFKHWVFYNRVFQAANEQVMQYLNLVQKEYEKEKASIANSGEQPSAATGE